MLGGNLGYSDQYQGTMISGTTSSNHIQLQSSITGSTALTIGLRDFIGG